jgi:hypothetical protein
MNTVSKAKEKRDKQIGDWYTQLRKKLSERDSIEVIFNSEENKGWCLTEGTIKQIATYKNYSNIKAQRAANPKF